MTKKERLELANDIKELIKVLTKLEKDLRH